MSLYDFDYDEPEINKLDMTEVLDSLSELRRKAQPTSESTEQNYHRYLDNGESNESDIYSSDNTSDTLDNIDILPSSQQSEHEPAIDEGKEPEPELDASSIPPTANGSEDIYMLLEALEKKFGVEFVPSPGPIDTATVKALKEALAPFHKDFASFIPFISENTKDLYLDRELFLFITVCLLYEHPENYIYLFNRYFMETDPLYRHGDVIEKVISEANKQYAV